MLFSLDRLNAKFICYGFLKFCDWYTLFTFYRSVKCLSKLWNNNNNDKEIQYLVFGLSNGKNITYLEAIVISIDNSHSCFAMLHGNTKNHSPDRSYNFQMDLYPMFETFQGCGGGIKGFPTSFNHSVRHQGICNQFRQEFEYRMFSVRVHF